MICWALLVICSTVAAADTNRAKSEKALARTTGDTLGPALNDSLVIVGEQLADRLQLERIWHRSETDSLEIEIKYLKMENEFLKRNQKRWYHDERLWFLVGSLAAYATVNVVAD